VVERWALKRADGIFGPSYNIAQYVEKDIKRKVDVIESPYIHESLKMDTTLYTQILNEKKYLLFMGRLSIAKGILSIAEILKDLLNMFPYLHFVFIGKEQMKYQGKAIMDFIRDKAGENRDRVIYPGRVQHSQLYPIIRNSQAVVLPSLIDNFPNVCLEAMALKQIVIGTSGTSFEQLIKDKYSGFLCEPNNPKSLIKVISEVLDLPVEKRREIGENAFKRVSELTPGKVVTKLVRYYDKIVSERQGDRL
jgi:glycosyltransferase involved in cell wall biosynthesis